jgi:GR25 family glycosyltransferase involved in LPS biosynthesis
MRLHVLNLAKRADRRAQFLAWNERPGIEVAFADAVIGADLDRDQLQRDGLIDGLCDTFSLGALGNALSHRALWRTIEASSDPAYVCEDDACLRGDFAEQAPALVAQLPAGWDIVFLGYNTNALVATATPDGLGSLLTFDGRAKQDPTYFESFRALKVTPPTALPCFQVWGTLCYAISPAGAAKLLELCFPLQNSIHINMYGQNRRVQCYSLDSQINVVLQRQPVAAYCAFPLLAASANDPHSSDVVAPPA